MKILLIVSLIGLLGHLLFGRFFIPRKGNADTADQAERDGFLLVGCPANAIGRATKSALQTVGMGIVLFAAILLLGMKVRVLWIALPLALYLIGQFFVCTNHVKTVKNMRIYFHPRTNDLYVQRIGREDLRFNLLRDVVRVTEVKAVQKNRGMLFGYCRLHLENEALPVPYLLLRHGHPDNRTFLAHITDNFEIKAESRLFPII